jgi:hypothetical protein
MDGAYSIQFDHLKEAEEEGDGTKDAGGTGDLEGAGSAGVAARLAAGLAARAAGGTLGLVRASSLRVGLLATAGVDTLDDRVVLVALELLASIVEVLVGLEVEGTLDVLEGREVGFLDGVAVHVKSTANGLEDGETGDISKLGVVLDGETTGDGGKLGERDVGGLLVADNGEGATDVGKVRGLEALEEVAVETEGAVDGGERGEADGGGVGNGDTGGPLKVGEDDGDVASVGVHVQLGANVAKLHGDVVEVVVVLDVQGVDHCEVDTVERVQLGVADADAVGLLDHVGLNLYLMQCNSSLKQLALPRYGSVRRGSVSTN